MKNKNTAILGLITLILISVMVAGCQTQTATKTVAKTTSNHKINIPGSQFPSNRFFFLAQEKGFFKQEGVDAVVRDIPDDQVIQAFAAGEFDFLHVSPDWFAIIKSQGVDGNQILYFEKCIFCEGLAVSKNITSLKDLKGKKVALWEGTLLHFQLLLALKDQGLTKDDIEIVSLPPDQAIIAFIAGDVDAAAAYQPWLSQYKEREGAKLLYVDKDLSIPGFSSLAASNDMIKNRPEDVKAVLRGYFRAVEYWKENTTEANEIMGKSIGISGAEFQQYMNMTHMLDYEESVGMIKDGTVDNMINQANDIWLKEGIIKKPLTKQESFDGSLLENISS